MEHPNNMNINHSGEVIIVAEDGKDPEKFLHTGPFIYNNLKFSDPS